MLESIVDILGLRDMTATDALDIAVLSILIYYLIMLVRGTRAAQMLVGMALILLASWLTRELDLKALNKVMDYAIRYVPFIVIVVFQGEIRKALTAIGRNPLFGAFVRSPMVNDIFHEIVYAVTTLSARKVGMLIVIERSQGLRNYVESGIRIEAVVSYDLLVNIFVPDTPLHDGAVIIQEDRMTAASCFLPLTLNPSLSKSYGTRHRAAIGITEETDAVAIVVSEETGQISVAVGGKLTSGLWAEALNQMLRTLFEVPEPAKKASDAKG